VRLPPFGLHAPRSLDDALGLLGETGGETRVVSGGTALLSLMRLGLVRPDRAWCRFMGFRGSRSSGPRPASSSWAPW
jgi:hypothetical protein